MLLFLFALLSLSVSSACLFCRECLERTGISFKDLIMGLIIFVYPVFFFFVFFFVVFFSFLSNNFKILILLKSHKTEITLYLHILLIPGHFKFKFRSIFNSYLIFFFAIHISSFLSLFLSLFLSFFWFLVGEYSNKKKKWHLYIFTKLQMEKKKRQKWGGGGSGFKKSQFAVRPIVSSFFLSFNGIETYWAFIFPTINV